MVIESPTTVPELLTVRDFADRANVSSQYVYKLLNSKLAAYVTTVDNRKLISSDALKLFAEDINAPTTEVANEYMEKLFESYRLTIDCLQVENSRLASQLEVKDLQIQSASDRLHESHVITMQLTDRQQQLYLTAIADAEAMERADSTHTDTPEPPQTTPEQPVKLKWYQRLFSRLNPT